MLTIPTITLYNPHAQLVALNEKQNETRGWPTKYRGPLFIHAGAFRGWKDLIQEEPFKSVLAQHGYINWKELPFGVVVAVCDLTDCVKITREYRYTLTDQELAFGDYAIGRFAWVLKNIHTLKTPIQFKGRQGIWKWDATPHLVTIDPFMIGPTKIWTPKGIRHGKIVNPDREDAISGLEVVG